MWEGEGGGRERCLGIILFFFLFFSLLLFDKKKFKKISKINKCLGGWAYLTMSSDFFSLSFSLYLYFDVLYNFKVYNTKFKIITQEYYPPTEKSVDDILSNNLLLYSLTKSIINSWVKKRGFNVQAQKKNIVFENFIAVTVTTCFFLLLLFLNIY